MLYPTSLAMIRPDEFEEMKAGDREIGFAWIKVGGGHRTEESKKPLPATEAAGFASDLAALLGKYGFSGGSTPGQLLEVATGQMTLEQINLVYKHMPVDFSYVDENEIVRFYTDTDHRVFPRSKNVIGRDVKNCHPRTSVHLVEEIIDKFRRGEQDEVDFWINKPGLFIYIYYVAVRDEEGRFRGILEMMQDCTRIRSLEGSRTLLSWDKSNKAASKHSDTPYSAPASTPAPEAPSTTDKQAEDGSEYVSCSCMKGASHAPKAPEAPQAEASTSAPAVEASAPATAKTATEITGATRLKDLLEQHPWLKAKLPEINPAFKMLSTPLARIMIPKATVAMMSERSGMPLTELIAQLQRVISEHKG